MRRHGGKIAIVALCLGILIGLGIQGLKSYIARELFDVLNDEARKACNCNFAVDTVDVSLLTLSATARNPRIESNGKRALWFKTVKAYFDLSQYKNHIAIIDLDLTSGHSEGVGPDSPTVLFITSLTEPIAPERDTPDRWKIQLRSLSASKSTFNQEFPDATLYGEGFSLLMKRDELDNFPMTAKVAKLRVAVPEDNSDRITNYEVGNATGSLYLKDDTLDFQKIAVALKDSLFESTATVGIDKPYPLSGGTFDLSLKADSLPVDLPISGELPGIGTVSSNIDTPHFQGKLRTAPGKTISVPIGDFDPLQITSITGDLDAQRLREGSHITVNNLTAEGSGLQAKATTPFVLAKSSLNGEMSFSGDEFTVGMTTIRGISGTMKMFGPHKTPSFRVEGTATGAQISALPLPGFNFSILNRGFRAEFAVTRTDEGKQSLNATGAIRYEDETFLEPTTITLNGYPLGDLANPYHPVVNGSAKVGGPCSTEGIEAKGEISLGAKGADGVLSGPVTVQHGVATFNGTGYYGTVETTLQSDLSGAKESLFSAKATDLDLTKVFPSLDCGTASGTLSYNYSMGAAALGHGSMDLDQLAIGCRPNVLPLKKPIRLPIQRGELVLDGLEVGSDATSIKPVGGISFLRGYDFHINGDLDLAGLLGVLPSVDNMSGHVAAKVTVGGPLYAGTIDGSLSVTDASVWIESVGVAVEHIKGELGLSQERIVVKDIAGEFNNGTFKATGEVFPFDIGRSLVTLDFQKITFEPQPDTSLTMSGQIELKRSDAGGPSLFGTVNLEGGEIRENFDLPSILRLVAQNLISRSRVAIRDQELPNIGVDLQIKGPRNLFLLTNLAAGEFSADLAVRGTLANPVVTGEVKTLSGWIGLKNRRFDITSGILNFSAASSVPTLELLGETYLPSRTGEYALVLLDVRGGLSNPSFKLSSDQGLSESEILALLSQSGTALRGTRANSVSDLTDDPSSGLLEDVASLNLRRVVRGLARIDSISIEPVYNQQTGSIEPALVAEKRLARRLNLRGESAFGGTSSVSRAKLAYDLTRVLSLEGLVETDPTKQTNPLEANFIYTILARQTRFLFTTITGNNEIPALDILEALRLGDGSRVPESDLPRLEEALVAYYGTQGFMGTSARAQCEAASGFCRKLDIEVTEGPVSNVGNVVLTGDPLPENFPADALVDLTSVRSGRPATSRLLERTRTRWIERLRAEGYIGARVRADFTPASDPHVLDLTINISLSRPVSFTFQGNTIFSAEDFLGTINLFDRKQPFGNNTISILYKNMERLYRQKGYLDATVTYIKFEDGDLGRIRYIVTVTEGLKVRVSAVSIEGLDSYSIEKVRAGLKRSDPELLREIFDPTAAVAEEIESHAKAIQEVMVEAGYPDAAVKSEILPDSAPDSVRIAYTVTEGDPLLIPEIEVTGLPSEVAQPKLPETPCAIGKVNEYLDQVLESARDGGFLEPSASIEMSPSALRVIIAVTAGAKTTVGAITVDGNSGIESSVILAKTSIKPGDPWSQSALDRSRRTLLQLGLFSRVDLGPRDGGLDSPVEDLVVTVVERPRQTLEAGVGANSEYGLHLFGEASDRGFFADGRTLSFRFDTYWDSLTSSISQGVGLLRYSSPHVFDTKFNLNEDVRFQRLELSTLPYNLDRLSLASYIVGAEAGRTYSFGHTVLQEDLSDVDPGSILSSLDSGTNWLSFLSGSMSIDRRDNPLNPTSGYYGSVEYRVMGSVIGSDADMHSLNLHGSLVQPLTPTDQWLFLALNSKLASSWTFGDTNDVPISQRYFLGGRTSVRGFKENSLGPRADDDSVIGGDLLALGNSELRFVATNAAAVHLFLDTGTVYLKDRSVSLGALRYSTGVGLRYLSPIGPIGVDIGFPMDRHEDESAYRIHFTIGNNF